MTALRQRKPDQALRDALQARSEYPGLQRPTRIDRFGDGAADAYMTVVKNGRFELVGR